MNSNTFAVAKDVVVPLFTLFFSGLVATIVSYWLNKQSQRREILRIKLEDAYVACDSFCNALGSYHLACFPLFKGEIDLNQFNDQAVVRAEGKDSSAFRRLEMIVHIYAKDALSPFEELMAIREELGELRGEHRRRFLRGEQVMLDLIPRLQVAIAKIDEAERAIKAAITKSARRL